VSNLSAVDKTPVSVEATKSASAPSEKVPNPPPVSAPATTSQVLQHFDMLLQNYEETRSALAKTELILQAENDMASVKTFGKNMNCDCILNFQINCKFATA
jgi:sugar/nucleoside kinase (ribokinase family)